MAQRTLRYSASHNAHKRQYHEICSTKSLPFRPTPFPASSDYLDFAVINNALSRPDYQRGFAPQSVCALRMLSQHIALLALHKTCWLRAETNLLLPISYVMHQQV